MKSFPVRFVVLAAALMFTFVRCGSDSVTAPKGVISVTLNPPAATLKVGATAQITVTATQDGLPVTGQTITFSSDNPAVVTVTSSGLLHALTIGTANITATSSAGASASGKVTVVAGDPASLAKTAGDNQSAQVGTAVSVPPSVTVRESAGNPVAGATVTFAVSGGLGSITGGTATTNASGVATVGSWTVGVSVGGNLLTATVAGVAPVTFSATAIPNPIGSIAINAGNGQTAATGVAVTVAPSVIVLNGVGQPSAGVTVTFAVASGGGSITGATATTNTAGIASVG